MTTNQNAGQQRDSAPKASDSNAEIQLLVDKAQRIKSQIETLNSQLQEVNEAITAAGSNRSGADRSQ
jgi:prefoldin subunit 5